MYPKHWQNEVQIWFSSKGKLNLDGFIANAIDGKMVRKAILVTHNLWHPRHSSDDDRLRWTNIYNSNEHLLDSSLEVSSFQTEVSNQARKFKKHIIVSWDFTHFKCGLQSNFQFSWINLTFIIPYCCILYVSMSFYGKIYSCWSRQVFLSIQRKFAPLLKLSNPAQVVHFSEVWLSIIIFVFVSAKISMQNICFAPLQ